MKKKPLYIQLEPGAYPKDIDWQSMSPADRGCYHSLIIYLACSDGKLPNDTAKLASLCNTTGESFDNFWKSFNHKFIEKDNHITHKRVTEELASARKRIKQKSLAGKKGMQQRYNTVTTPLQQKPNEVITKVSKGKVRKEKKKELPKESGFPEQLNTPAFRSAWDEWVAYRIERKKRLTKSTAEKQIKKLSQYTADDAVAVICRSIEMGWIGLFPDDIKVKPTQTCAYCPATEGLRRKRVNDKDVYFCEGCRGRVA